MKYWGFLAVISVLLLCISCISIVQAVEPLQVTVTATPSTLSAGGASAQIFVKVMYRGSPLQGAKVTLQTDSELADVSYSSDGTDSSGVFPPATLRTTLTSGSIRVTAFAQKSTIDMTYGGSGYVDVPVQSVIIIPLEPVVLVSTTTPIPQPQPYQPPQHQPYQPPQPPYQPPVPQEPQPGGNQQPVAVISVDQYAGKVTLTVNFDGQKSYAPTGSINQYTWNFGDGSTGSGYHVQHQYTTPGTYVASLGVIDNNGLSSNPATIQISVQPTITPYETTPAQYQSTPTPYETTPASYQSTPTPQPQSSVWNSFFAMFSSSPSPQPTKVGDDEITHETMSKATETVSTNEGIFASIMNFPSWIFQGLLVPNAPSATSPGSHAPIEKSDVNVFSCMDTGGTKCPAGCRYLKIDPKNCGSCGNSCPPIAYSEPVCINGECSFSCLQDYADCNKYSYDGCEVNIATDPNNCGVCGRRCRTDQVCRNKECQCPTGKNECNGKCVDLRQDSKNCGSCGKICDNPQFCENGVCKCDNDKTYCNGECVNLISSYKNCGYCGHNCHDICTYDYPYECCSGVCCCEVTGGGGGCFIASTPISIYNSFKPISTVQSGDVILSYDLNMNQVINRTITDVYIHKKQSVLRLEFENDIIICTPIQPFFTGTWTLASQLKAGDKVLCRDNHWETLIKDPVPAGLSDVYNLHGYPSEEYQASYYVGKSQLLVHNKFNK